MNKMTPQIRFQGFTDDWEERKFFESMASTIDFRGRTPKKLGMDWSESGYLALSALNVKNGYIDPLADAHYGDENLYKKWMSGKELKKGQVLFTTEAPMGNVAQVPDNNGYILSQRTVAFETKEDMMTNDFLAVLLKSPLVSNNLSALSSGGTAKGVSQKSLKGLSITVPFDIDEQQKIGSFFKQLDDTIALHQRKLDLLKEQKKGFLQKMFPKNGAKVPELRFSGFADDWEERNLGNIAGNLSDGDWIESNHIFDTGKYRIVQTGNIGIGSFLDKPQNAKYFHQADFDELKANEIFSGDILISRLSDPAGRTSILPDLGVPAVTAVDVAIIRPTDNFNSEFLVSELNSSAILSKVDSLASGSTRKRISRKNLESVKISLPTFEEQQKIGSFFKQLDDTIALHQRKLDLLKEQKKGFLQKMVV